MGALIATHHSSRRMNKTLLLVVSAIALATAVQPDVSVPADAFTEAAQLVQSMQKQGQDDNACLQLAKDFEDEVKTNVAALQEAQGNLDTGADCDNAGQSGVTAAKKVRDDAKDAVDNAQKAFNTANTAAVTIGTFAFNTLKPGNCGMFFSTSAYTSTPQVRPRGHISQRLYSAKHLQGDSCDTLRRLRCLRLPRRVCREPPQ